MRLWLHQLVCQLLPIAMTYQLHTTIVTAGCVYVVNVASAWRCIRYNYNNGSFQKDNGCMLVQVSWFHQSWVLVCTCVCAAHYYPYPDKNNSDRTPDRFLRPMSLLSDGRQKPREMKDPQRTWMGSLK